MKIRLLHALIQSSGYLLVTYSYVSSISAAIYL